MPNTTKTRIASIKNFEFELENVLDHVEPSPKVGAVKLPTREIGKGIACQDWEQINVEVGHNDHA